MRAKLFHRLAIFALPIFAAACADFDMFDEKKTPVTGDRRALFPGGVPGVDYNAPIPQPSNSNIAVDTPVTKTGNEAPQNPDAQKPAQSKKLQRDATGASRNAQQTPSPRSTARSADPVDPWSDARTTN